jgi:hypothetical protein
LGNTWNGQLRGRLDRDALAWPPDAADGSAAGGLAAAERCMGGERADAIALGVAAAQRGF